MALWGGERRWKVAGGSEGEGALLGLSSRLLRRPRDHGEGHSGI